MARTVTKIAPSFLEYYLCGRQTEGSVCRIYYTSDSRLRIPGSSLQPLTYVSLSVTSFPATVFVARNKQ